MHDPICSIYLLQRLDNSTGIDSNHPICGFVVPELVADRLPVGVELEADQFAFSIDHG